MTRTLDADAVIADLRITANAFWVDALAYARLGQAEEARIARTNSAVVQQIARTLDEQAGYGLRLVKPA